MLPTDDQIRVAAYHRWQRRGHAHGHHAADWLAAEQDLLLALNYRAIAHCTAESPTRSPLVERFRVVCRFCEQAPPRTTFPAPRPLPSAAPAVPLPPVDDVCDACRQQFADTLSIPLDRFLNSVRAGTLPATVPIAAYKGLVQTALSMLPAPLLELFPDALEWAANPDTDLLDSDIARRGVIVHALERHQRPWSALVARTDPEAPMPYVLAFLGSDSATIELPMPMCLRDEDLDGEAVVEPLVPSLDGLTRDAGPYSTRRLRVVRDAAPRRGRFLSLDLP
jgi:hypothetical protein